VWLGVAIGKGVAGVVFVALLLAVPSYGAYKFLTWAWRDILDGFDHYLCKKYEERRS
jgi:hypothetical protein